MVNPKKLKKQDKLAKKAKTLKTKEERQAEVDTLKEKLRSLGLGDGFPEILGIHKTMETYVSDGEPQTQNITIPGIGRRLQMILPTKKHITASITAIAVDPRTVSKSELNALQVKPKVKTVKK